MSLLAGGEAFEKLVVGVQPVLAYSLYVLFSFFPTNKDGTPYFWDFPLDSFSTFAYCFFGVYYWAARTTVKGVS